MTTEPPSRESNPFATCWTEPGALPYLSSPNGERTTLDAVVGRLERSGWRGFLVGPHGSGKTTLVAALKERLGRAGIDSVRWDPRQDSPSADLLIVEGVERLPIRQATRQLLRWRLSGQRFLVTTHSVPCWWRMFAPEVGRLRPDRRLLARLYERLTFERPTPVRLVDAEVSFSQRRGNLREVWFDLYNRHECQQRSGRTAEVQATYV